MVAKSKKVAGGGGMKVVIDDREPAEFAELFRAAGAKSVSVAHLSMGDFIVNGRWLFERKTMGDFCASLVDGRLFKQALRMLQWEGPVVLLLEGGSRECTQSHVSREAIQGALITLSVFLKIPVLRALDSEEAVRLIGYVVEQEMRFSKGSVVRHGYRPKKRRARQLYILQGLPGIGRERAENLLEAFGSIEAVVMAEAEELAEVEGIGKVIAGRIREIVGKF